MKLALGRHEFSINSLKKKKKKGLLLQMFCFAEHRVGSYGMVPQTFGTESYAAQSLKA